jgi:hypothetical protein
MKTSSLLAAALCASLLVPAGGCAVNCIENGGTTTCSAKSLQRVDGAPIVVQPLDKAPGAGLTIDVVYGNVTLARSTSGKFEVQFLPFVYSAHDNRAYADQQLAQNLRAAAVPGPTGLTVSVRREGGSNGLGADTIVRVPDDFDGGVTIVNHGSGSLNNFDVKVEFVGRASALNVTNSSQLGGCWIQAAPTVRSTTVQCAEQISVFDVADDVNITNTEPRHDAEQPAIVLRLASVSPNSRGGRVSAASAGAAPDYIGTPKDNNVLIAFQ